MIACLPFSLNAAQNEGSTLTAEDVTVFLAPTSVVNPDFLNDTINKTAALYWKDAVTDKELIGKGLAVFLSVFEGIADSYYVPYSSYTMSGRIASILQSGFLSGYVRDEDDKISALNEYFSVMKAYVDSTVGKPEGLEQIMELYCVSDDTSSIPRDIFLNDFVPFSQKGKAYVRFGGIDSSFKTMWGGGDRVRSHKTGYQLLKPAIELFKEKSQLSKEEIQSFETLCDKVCFDEFHVITATQSVYAFMVANTEDNEKKALYQATLDSDSYFDILWKNQDGSLYGPDFIELSRW